MKPVYQREQHDPAAGIWGDCHRAALASLLELPLSAVPHFTRGARTDWRERERAWLAGMGLEPALAEIPAADQGEALRRAARINPDPASHYLLTGSSSTDGLTHSVVCLGDRVAHDPDPEAVKGLPALSGPIRELGRFVACFMVPLSPSMRAPAAPEAAPLPGFRTSTIAAPAARAVP